MEWMKYLENMKERADKYRKDLFGRQCRKRGGIGKEDLEKAYEKNFIECMFSDVNAQK